VSIPRTTPCCSGSAFLLTIALMAGYMILADAASIPATHISLAEREGERVFNQELCMHCVIKHSYILLYTLSLSVSCSVYTYT
jgi:hypothetical protein